MNQLSLNDIAPGGRGGERSGTLAEQQ